MTGAGGFIGGAIARRLLAEGRKVKALSRRPVPALSAAGAEVIVGDLDDREALRIGCLACEAVFHVAGRVGVWGKPEDFFEANVEGTRKLMAAAQRANVPRFIYTSSPSVIYTGRDLRYATEAAPLCTAAPSPYPVSKALAEQEVLAANSKKFSTVALRPHLVWGPGDRHLVPRILRLARAGRLRIVGSGRNRVDLTYISNVVDAHLLAEDALLQSGNPVAGKPYFITNGEPVVLWEWINELLQQMGIPPVTRRVPLAVAHAAGHALETFWRIARRRGEPPMTRFVAKELATDHYFNINNARIDLGYIPQVSMAAGIAEYLKEFRRAEFEYLLSGEWMKKAAPR